MSTLRKLRKSIKKGSEPLILFVPKEDDRIVKFVTAQPDIITVTDRTIYEHVLEAVTAAIKQNRTGVIRGTKNDRSKSRRKR